MFFLNNVLYILKAHRIRNTKQNQSSKIQMAKKNGFTPTFYNKKAHKYNLNEKQSQKLHSKLKRWTQQKTASQNQHSLPPQTITETIICNL
jgi:hypothetical protein